MGEDDTALGSVESTMNKLRDSRNLNDILSALVDGLLDVLEVCHRALVTTLVEMGFRSSYENNILVKQLPLL